MNDVVTQNNALSEYQKRIVELATNAAKNNDTFDESKKKAIASFDNAALYFTKLAIHNARQMQDKSDKVITEDRVASVRFEQTVTKSIIVQLKDNGREYKQEVGKEVSVL